MKKRCVFVLWMTVLCLACMGFASASETVGKPEDLTGKEMTETNTSEPIPEDSISDEVYKTVLGNNPISSEVFCADPTAVEYNGRLYVFGTNDHEQYTEKGPDSENTYEKIHSLVIFSTEDMKNWVYHGKINVSSIAPWIYNSWAPSITSRVEEDGLTHFYLYFSNSGAGVGVLTATDPLGPWTDPLGKPLISPNTEGLEGCPNPFDPGVVIDDEGNGWLAFGGGDAPDGTTYMPGSARIVKLGDDMLSFDSDFMEIPAPYFFEASELNYINGTFVYTYCSDWENHSAQWEYDCPAPGACSMIYMTTKNPLDPDGWTMKGECFKNPGQSGFDYSNNHTHLHKYQGEYYMFYHTLAMRKMMGLTVGYRSLSVDKVTVDEETVTILPTGGTQAGVVTGQTMKADTAHLGSELNNASKMIYWHGDNRLPLAVSGEAGAWTSYHSVEFAEGEKAFLAEVKGTGRIEVRKGSRTGEIITYVDFDSPDYTVVYSKAVAEIAGTQDIYFVYSKNGLSVRSWQFTDAAKISEKEPEPTPEGNDGTVTPKPEDETAANETEDDKTENSKNSLGMILLGVGCVVLCAVGGILWWRKRK